MLPGPRFLRHFSGGAKNAFKGLRWPLHRLASALPHGTPPGTPLGPPRDPPGTPPGPPRDPPGTHPGPPRDPHGTPTGPPPHRPIDPSTHRPIDPSTHRPIDPSTHRSICCCCWRSFFSPSSGLRQKEGGEGGPDFPDLTGKEGNFRKAAAVATRRPPRANQGPRKLAPQTSKIVRTRGRRKATGGPKIHNREVHSTKSKTSPRDVLLPGPERVKKPASWDTRGPPRTNPGSPTRAKGLAS